MVNLFARGVSDSDRRRCAICNLWDERPLLPAASRTLLPAAIHDNVGRAMPMPRQLMIVQVRSWLV